MSPSSADSRGCFRVASDPRSFRAAIFVVLFAAACGGEPDGGLLEVHASLDASITEELAAYRVYRVGVHVDGVDGDPFREVERTSPPPDVFVVRSPVSVSSPGETTMTVWVQALRFTEAGTDVVGCALRPDVTVIEDAINLIEVTLMPGDCL